MQKRRKEKGYLTVRQTAKKLKIKVATVRRYIQTGELEAEQHENGKRWYVLKASIEAFLERNSINRNESKSPKQHGEHT